MMKNIMFICHGAGNGGAERVITTLANEFSKKDYNVYLVTTNEDKNDYHINDSIIRERVLVHSNSVLIRTFQRIKRMRNIVKDNKIDFIISFSSIPNMQVLVATLGMRKKIIISERTDPKRYPNGRFAKILRNVIYPLATKVVFQTAEARDYFKTEIINKSIIIFNPIRNDLPPVYQGKRKKKIVGIGSLSEQKNWMVALKACEKFLLDYPDYSFDIYGEGPKRQELQNYINSKEVLIGRVNLKGFATDAVEHMNDAKMYISSSDYEGISNSMLEALATGVPTICTDCPVGGARQFIKDHINGILVNVNSPVELEHAMRELANDEALAESFSKKSVLIREDLSLDSIVNQWENLINE